RLPPNDRRDRRVGHDGAAATRGGLATDRRTAARQRGKRRRSAEVTIALPASVRFVERDWLSSNQIFLVDGDTATVVDTGYVKHAPATVAIVGHLLEQTDTRL